MTRATGRLIAIAATFMMKFVMISTKNAIPRMKTKGGASRKRMSQFTASHSAAPVFQRQNPIDIAPPKSRTMFHGNSSRSFTVSTLNTKKSTVAVRITALLSNTFRAGTSARTERNAIAANTMTRERISRVVILPSRA